MTTEKKYLSLKNTRIRTRLQREVFNGPAVDIYGENTGRLEREERFASVRTALAHLLHHQHYTSDIEMGEYYAKFQNSYNELMSLPDIKKYFGQKRVKRISELASEILAIARKIHNSNFTSEDIRLFVEISAKGRDHYANQGYDPDEFAEKNMVVFASLIAGNFEAYRATLNHEYV